MNDQSPSFPPEAVAYTCPHCRAGATVRARRIFDTRDEDARREALGGRFLSVVCPSCGAPGRLTAPILFHDATTESAFVLLPGGLAGSRAMEEKEIGRLTNRVLESLSPEQRKMYLLQPSTFISEQTFHESVLEALGIDKSELERARERGKLIEQLVRATSDEAFDAALAARPEAGDDYSLMMAVRTMAESASAAGDANAAGALAQLLERLIDRLGEPKVSLDQLADVLAKAQADGMLDEAVAYLRPALDYGFFTALTRKADGMADAHGKDSVLELRRAVLDAMDRHDEAMRAEMEQAVETLKAVLKSPDREAALRDHADQLTQAFFLVLDANIEAAIDSGRTEVEEGLKVIRAAALGMVEAALPERERLVNRLARAGSASERVRLLDEAPGLVDDELRQLLARTAEEAREAGASEVADNLAAAAQLVTSGQHVEAQP